MDLDLRHHVGLSLGPAVDMTNWSPEANLERALCPASLADTLGLQRRAYWDEVNPLLKQWKNVNNSNCPDCKQFIKVNMGRHIRLKHSTYMCFWRCPVISCSVWFTSELNAKDHIEGIHKFQEGRGTSFYECLRQHGIEWFGSRECLMVLSEFFFSVFFSFFFFFSRQGFRMITFDRQAGPLQNFNRSHIMVIGRSVSFSDPARSREKNFFFSVKNSTSPPPTCTPLPSPQNTHPNPRAIINNPNNCSMTYRL